MMARGNDRASDCRFKNPRAAVVWKERVDHNAFKLEIETGGSRTLGPKGTVAQFVARGVSFLDEGGR